MRKSRKSKEVTLDSLYEESKEEPKKKRKHSFLWYLNPISFKNSILEYDGTLSFKKIGVYLLVYSMCTISLSYILNMQLIYAIIMYIAGVLFVPQLIISSYKLDYENKKYADANVYIEQLLYAFAKSKKIVASLEAIKIEFKDSKMYECISKAIYYIMSYSNNDVEDIELEGLKLIENEYPLKKIITIHQFLRKVENLGGDCNKSIELLQEDRSNWEKRILSLQKDKQVKRNRVVGAIAVSTIVVIVFSLLLSRIGFDITHNVAVQIATIFMWFFDMLVLSIADKKINSSEFDERDVEEPKDSLRRYYRIINWDNKKEFIKSLIWAIVPFALTILFIIKDMPIGICICAVITVLMLFQHRLGYRLYMKIAKREIEEKFPDWLMEIALLLQYENVYVSLYNSYATAPAIFKPEIKKLIKEIQERPNEIEPYLDFMSAFNISSIRSTMKILYSRTQGIGGSADEQIAEIIRKNNQLVDKINEYKDDNSLATYLVMFWLPGLFAGGKLIVDMFAFMVLSMTDMSVFIK
ncbi:MAG: hypothetical protein E7279_01555 [Lachnospiraceae bacterium]|nr:hypothetical protein [Lachnospiraceae bacterium]